MSRANSVLSWVQLKTRERTVPYGLVVFIGALLLFSIEWPYSLSDRFFNLYGGVSTVGAVRVLDGEVPYRDFWTMYAPGQFYVLALLFKLFGTNLWIEVIAASVVCAAVAYLCYQFITELTGRKAAGFACSTIFVAAMYQTAYFKRLGSYPWAVLLILLALLFLMRYFRSQKRSWLMAAGLATGVMFIFKHDVSAYTTIAILVGILTHRLFTEIHNKVKAGLRLRLEIGTYSIALALVAVPILLPLIVVAGRPMLTDLVVFPLTDFPYSRPERYPGLIPTGIFDPSPIEFVRNLSQYIFFAIPFILFMLGLVAIGLTIAKENIEYATFASIFSVGFLLHYEAAHVQINTHIVTLSLYAAFSGSILYDFLARQFAGQRRSLIALSSLGLVCVWLLSLSLKPLYTIYYNRVMQTSWLQLERVSGFKVSPDESRALEGMIAFVNSQIPRDQKIFVGLHRHDVVVVGDFMVNFILSRPIATRYHELHPAIVDTASVQREIIRDLQENKVSLIIRKHIFTDEVLDQVKNNFRQKLPLIGATDLDSFISQNYGKVKEFGPYEIWMIRK